MQEIKIVSHPTINILDEEWSWKTLSLKDFISEGNCPGKWSEFFLRKDIVTDTDVISEKLKEESKDCTIYPPINRVFRAFSLPLEKIKVVILGQDPYHNSGSAVGLCFSVPQNSYINPSLGNIYTELEKEGYKPKRTGSLEHWVKQGCLLLNTALTVRKCEPDSHTELWSNFTEKILCEISAKTKNVIWLLMGAKAQRFERHVNTARGHSVFLTSHPSPFSAYKGFRAIPAFIGSGVFKKINSCLDMPIAW